MPYFWSRGKRRWQWCRVYHRDAHNPQGDAARTFGPLARFDPHTPDPDHPSVDPAGRSVLYFGDGLATSGCEVFGEAGEALICPSWRVALLEPVTRIRLLDLVRPGSAMAIGALPALADGALPRSLTQEWARAICEDNPLGAPAAGIRYRSAYNGGVALALWGHRRTDPDPARRQRNRRRRTADPPGHAHPAQDPSDGTTDRDPHD